MLRSVLAQEYPATLPSVIKFIANGFLFVPEQGSFDWNNLVDAIKNNTHYKLVLSPKTYIEVNEEIVYFGLSGNGDMIISLDSYKCLEAFENAVRITNEQNEEMVVEQ